MSEPMRFDIECFDCRASLKNVDIDEVTRFGAIHYRVTISAAGVAVARGGEPSHD